MRCLAMVEHGPGGWKRGGMPGFFGRHGAGPMGFFRHGPFRHGPFGRGGWGGRGRGPWAWGPFSGHETQDAPPDVL